MAKINTEVAQPFNWFPGALEYVYSVSFIDNSDFLLVKFDAQLYINFRKTNLNKNSQLGAFYQFFLPNIPAVFARQNNAGTLQISVLSALPNPKQHKETIMMMLPMAQNFITATAMINLVKSVDKALVTDLLQQSKLYIPKQKEFKLNLIFAVNRPLYIELLKDNTPSNSVIRNALFDPMALQRFIREGDIKLFKRYFTQHPNQEQLKFMMSLNHQLYLQQAINNDQQDVWESMLSITFADKQAALNIAQSSTIPHHALLSWQLRQRLSLPEPLKSEKDYSERYYGACSAVFFKPSAGSTPMLQQESHSFFQQASSLILLLPIAVIISYIYFRCCRNYNPPRQSESFKHKML